VTRRVAAGVRGDEAIATKWRSDYGNLAPIGLCLSSGFNEVSICGRSGAETPRHTVRELLWYGRILGKAHVQEQEGLAALRHSA